MSVRVFKVFVVSTALIMALGLDPNPNRTRADDADAVLDMVVELLASPDRDMRGLALQQVREELPGEESTRRFVEELPKLSPDAQAGLLEALGERGDVAARAAVVDKVQADNEAVRVAAVGALAKLGGPDDVPLLAQQASEASEAVQTAARQSLIRLQGEKVNEVLLGEFQKAAPTGQANLLEILARRNAREAIPVVLEATRGEAASVRLAAIRALRLLASEEHAPELVEAVKAAQDETERYQAKLALMAVCGRDRRKAAEAILVGLEDAAPGATIALLEALARAGGDESLKAVAKRLQDDDDAVRAAAVRTLASWGDASAANSLIEIAQTTEEMRHHVVAVRGLALMAQARPEKPADIEKLTKALELAKRPQEKLMVLGFIGASGDSAAIAAVLPSLDVPDLAEPAALAAVLIAEQTEQRTDALREVLRKVIDTTKDGALRQRAQKVLESE